MKGELKMEKKNPIGWDTVEFITNGIVALVVAFLIVGLFHLVAYY